MELHKVRCIYCKEELEKENEILLNFHSSCSELMKEGGEKIVELEAIGESVFESDAIYFDEIEKLLNLHTDFEYKHLIVIVNELRIISLEIQCPCNLDKLIRSISKLKGLKSLTINYHLSQDYYDDSKFKLYYILITEDLIPLIGLETLKLKNMGLISFPKSICLLKNLIILDLSKNCLRSIPKEICNLSKLKKLDISNNLISVLPHSVFRLPDLKILNYDQFINEFSKKDKLELKEFGINENAFSFDDYLKEKDDWYRDHDRTEEEKKEDIELSNWIRTCKESRFKHNMDNKCCVGDIRRIKTFIHYHYPTLDSNLIEFKDEDSKKVNLIKKHDYIILMDILEYFKYKSLFFDSSLHYETGYNGLTFWSDYEIQNHNVRSLHFLDCFFDSYRGPNPNLMPIDEKNLETIEIVVELAKGFEKLEELTFQNLPLSKLPNNLSELTSLKKLSINGMLLEEVPEFISNLINLEDLNLENNCISMIPDFVFNLRNLKKIRLKRNPVYYLIDDELKEVEEIINIKDITGYGQLVYNPIYYFYSRKELEDDQEKRTSINPTSLKLFFHGLKNQGPIDSQIITFTYHSHSLYEEIIYKEIVYSEFIQLFCLISYTIFRIHPGQVIGGPHEIFDDQDNPEFIQYDIINYRIKNIEIDTPIDFNYAIEKISNFDDLEDLTLIFKIGGQGGYWYDYDGFNDLLSVMENLDYGVKENFCSLKKLKRIYIKNYPIRKINKNLFELENLTELYFVNCFLTDIPPEIANLKSLKILNLTGNTFGDSIPEHIFKLNVEKLTIIAMNIKEKVNIFEMKKVNVIETDVITAKKLGDLIPKSIIKVIDYTSSGNRTGYEGYPFGLTYDELVEWEKHYFDELMKRYPNG